MGDFPKRPRMKEHYIILILVVRLTIMQLHLVL